MTLKKTLLAATVATVALIAPPEPAQAQNGDPILRFLNSVFPNADFCSGSGVGGWDDDDDDGGRGGWDDDDDDGGRGGWDDDDDDGHGGGRDDDDDDGGANDDDD